MISVMAIRGEVFGSCVEEINLSVEIENGVSRFAAGGNI